MVTDDQIETYICVCIYVCVSILIEAISSPIKLGPRVSNFGLELYVFSCRCSCGRLVFEFADAS